MKRTEKRKLFVDLAQNANYQIEDVCEALAISRSCYYNWRRALLPEDFQKDQLQYKEFVKLYELNTLTLSRIAELLGCWPGTAWRYKRRYLKEKQPQSTVDSTLVENEPGELATIGQVPGSSEKQPI